jgi:hypothetical protein
VASREIGSLSWFLDSLKLDLDVLSRSLASARAPAAAPASETRSEPDDIAA